MTFCTPNNKQYYSPDNAKLLNFEGRDNTFGVYFTFKVRANNDACIKILNDDDFYKIELGSNKNTKSKIYFKEKVLKEENSKPLNGSEFREFTISIKRGIIKVAKGADPDKDVIIEHEVKKDPLERLMGV